MSSAGDEADGEGILVPDDAESPKRRLGELGEDDPLNDRVVDESVEGELNDGVVTEGAGAL